MATKKASTKPRTTPAKRSTALTREHYDYTRDELPKHVREIIETHLAIEAEDAKEAGALGFMARSLAIATLPHRRHPEPFFQRKNGDFTLTMMTAHPDGLPFGTLPRLLLSWVCTEAVKRRERVLNLGPSLSGYLRELGLNLGGGERGDYTRLRFQMATLFSAVISAHYQGQHEWALSNVLLAEKIRWWEPQQQDEAGEWRSTLMLSQPFYDECLAHPLPIDLRATKALRGSSLALDIYIWLTHRMSYLRRKTTIPWVSLAAQFGSGYANNAQGLRDFRRAFKRELKNVVILYPQANIEPTDGGLVLRPSPTHIAYSGPSQRSLW